jgi:hypothetical protein
MKLALGTFVVLVLVVERRKSDGVLTNEKARFVKPASSVLASLQLREQPSLTRASSNALKSDTRPLTHLHSYSLFG